MASEYMFFARRGTITKQQEAAAEAIAKKHGAALTYIPPSRTWTAANTWFTCPNNGGGERRAADVAADLRRAGLGFFCGDE